MVFLGSAILLLCSAVSADGETPAMAVLIAAAEVRGPDAPSLRIPASAFKRLPRPGPGVVFRAEALGPLNARTFRVKVEAWAHARRVAVSRHAFSAEPVRYVATLMRPVAKGQKISVKDIEMRPIAGVDIEDFFTSAKQVAGRIARFAMSAEMQVRRTSVRTAYVVKRGANIRVTVRAGTLSVAVVGVALQRGGVGDVIRVRNPRSKQLVDVVVTAKGEAEVRP